MIRRHRRTQAPRASIGRPQARAEAASGKSHPNCRVKDNTNPQTAFHTHLVGRAWVLALPPLPKVLFKALAAVDFE